MKIFPSCWFLFSVALFAGGPALQAQTPAVAPATPAPAPAAASHADAPSELLEQNFLFQIVRYLYRYQLDEAEIDKLATAKQVVFWVHRLHPRQDPEDHSQFGEVILPQLGCYVKLKLSDYRIEELGVDIKSRGFKVYQVGRGELPAQPPADVQVAGVEVEALLDYLFKSRFQRDFPEPPLLDRLRKVANEQVQQTGLKRLNLDEAHAGENIIHVGPLSPVSNEIWSFWESGRRLYHFTSDIDLSNPSVWERENLKVDIYDLDQQVVTSHEEAPGSNRFLTRYEVGRALYNCIVIGRRLELTADGVNVKPLATPVPVPVARPGK